MAPSNFTYDLPEPRRSVVKEEHIEAAFLEKLRSLKYTDRPDIRDRATLEQNFREKFQDLNRVRLSDAEFARLLDEIVTPDVFAAAKTLRQINAFTRDDGTPLNYTLVNIKDWCKNTFEIAGQLRINMDFSTPSLPNNDASPTASPASTTSSPRKPRSSKPSIPTRKA